MKNIDADYYGYRDEDDGRIIPLEQEMEKKGLIILWSYKQQPWLPSLHTLLIYLYASVPSQKYLAMSNL